MFYVLVFFLLMSVKPQAFQKSQSILGPFLLKSLSLVLAFICYLGEDFQLPRWPTNSKMFLQEAPRTPDPVRDL